MEEEITMNKFLSSLRDRIDTKENEWKLDPKIVNQKFWMSEWQELFNFEEN